MKIRLISFFALLWIMGAVAYPEKLFQDRKHFSEVLDENRNYRLFLPKDYYTSGKSYPVIYYFHGHSDRYTLEHYDNGTDTVPKIVDYVQNHEVIVVSVDGYLAEGNVEQAEQYMNQMRDILAAKGYHIRKLNQAYFAFHGTYADDPATVSPIGQDLQTLRERCGSLKEFLDKVSFMTGYGDLREVLEEY